jgi:hypothetical protein
MLDAFLIAAYITVVALLGLFVVRRYASYRVRKSWQHHSAFYRETD